MAPRLEPWGATAGPQGKGHRAGLSSLLPRGPRKPRTGAPSPRLLALGPCYIPCHSSVTWGNQRTRGLSCSSCPWFPDALLTLSSLLHRPGSGPGDPSPRYKPPREVPSSHIQLWDCYQQGQPMGGQQKLVLPFAGVTVTTSLLAPLPTSPRQQSTLIPPGRTCSQTCTRPLGQTQVFQVNRFERKQLFGV